jgi:hypothetical protein
MEDRAGFMLFSPVVVVGRGRIGVVVVVGLVCLTSGLGWSMGECFQSLTRPEKRRGGCRRSAIRLEVLWIAFPCCPLEHFGILLIVIRPVITAIFDLTSI